MSWIATSILGGAGLGLNYLSGKAKQNQDIAGMNANAEQIRYSPWTGMKSNVRGPQSGSPLLEGLKGGLGGATAGYLQSQANAAGGLGSTDQAQQKLMENAGPSALGGAQMSNQLGAQANGFTAQMNGAMPGAGGGMIDPSTGMPMQFAQLQKPNLYNPWK